MKVGTGVRGVRVAGGRVSSVSMVEMLESRRLFASTMLSSGTGAGALQVVVDAYGAFGLTPTGGATQATDFTVGNPGVVDRSYVYFAPVGRFLTSDVSGTAPVNSVNSPVLPEVTFTAVTPTSAVSSFRLTGTSATGETFDYDVELFQSVSAVGPTTLAGDIVNDLLISGEDPADFNLSRFQGDLQTELAQSYRITNRLGTPVSLAMTRFFQTSSFSFFFNVSSDGGRTLYADSGAGQTSGERFLRLRTDGGDFVGGAIRGTGLDAVIASRGGLTSDLLGVENGTDPTGDLEGNVLGTQFDAAFAQGSVFSIGGRESVVFRTSTTIGTGSTIQTISATNDTQISSVGDFAFSSSVQNFDFPVLPSGQQRPLTVTVNRLGGTRGSATVNLTMLTGSTTPAGAVSFSSQSLTFAEGQSTADVTITIDPTLAGAEPSQILLELSSPTAFSGVTGPTLLSVNVLPKAPVFALTPSGVATGPTYAAAQGDGTVGVTVYRRGLPNGPATVLLRAATGSASFADDVAVTFADGETEKVVQLPVRTTDVGTASVAVTLSVVTTTPPAGALASVAVGPTAALAVKVRDSLSPTVVRTTTTSSRNRITGVVLVFSEALASPGNLSNYVLSLRTSEGSFGASGVRGLALTNLVYDPATFSVTLTPQRPLAFNTNYQIQALAGGTLADLAGNGLNQTPGVLANYTAVFSQGNRASYVDRTGNNVRLRLSAGTFLLVRQSNGNAATTTLFGDSTQVGRLTGTVTARRNSGGMTPRGEITAPSNTLVDLPASFV